MRQELEVFVITLGESDRLESLESALRSYGLEWQRVEAIDARGWDDSQLSDLATPDAGRLIYGCALSAPQVGCHLSHRQAYRSFLSGTAAWALVLEDDAYPSTNVSTLLQSLCGWDAGRPTVVELFSDGRINETRQHIAFASGLDIQRLATFPGFTVAYAINRGAAQLALRHQGRVASRADWPQWAVHVQFWRTRPNVFHHGAPGNPPASTMGTATHAEPTYQKLLRWAGLISGVTYLRLKAHYPDGLGQFIRHAVLPSALYWRTRALKTIGWARPT